METHNIRHARGMSEFGQAKIEYIVPRQTWWQKLRGRTGVIPWRVTFEDGEVRQCHCYMNMKSSKYFFMKLKGLTETEDRAIAEKAMAYMKWDREIP